MTQSNIGDTLAARAETEDGEKRRESLAGAAKAYKEAQRAYTETEYPDRYQKLAKKILDLNSASAQGR